MKFLHFLCFIFISYNFFGQSSNWKFFQGLPVQQNNRTLTNPWSGSMNNAQVNTIDLNFDGLEDLWIFDRVAQRSIVFRQENKQWIYDYTLEKKLPVISDWLLLVDFDRDGKKDIFTSTAAGIKVLQNVSQNGTLSFTLVANPLQEEGFSGIVNLFIPTTDIPVIQDIDQDGDVDILAFESAGHVIEWHKNTSVEMGKKLGLNFQKTEGCWGNIVYQDCSKIYLNQGCSIPGVQTVKPKKEPQKLMHSGNTLSMLQHNGNYEVWMGHVGCTNVMVLKNEGTLTAPYFSTPIYQYPEQKPIAIPFPSTSFVDINFDGKLEAIVSPNGSDNVGYEVDFKQSVIRMDQENNIFSIKQPDFLQDSSIDVGENASPVFFDVDADGDLDVLIGNAQGQIYFYESDGLKLVLKSSNFGSIQSMQPGKELTIGIGDWNRDGVKELYAIGQTLFGPTLFIFQSTEKKWQKVSQKDLLPGDKVYWMDVDLDGVVECLILHRSGKVDLVEPQWQDNSVRIGIKQENLWNLGVQNFIIHSFIVFDELGIGQPVFIGVDREGMMKKAIVLANQLRFTAVDEELNNRFGKNIQLQSADLNQDGKKDLIVGTSGGGVMLFQNMNQSAVFDHKNQLIQLWPNPSSGEFFVRSTENGILKLIDMQGKILFSQNDFPKNESIKIDHNNLAKGVYYLQFFAENGKISSEKIIVQ